MRKTALFLVYIFLFKYGQAQCPPLITAGNNGPLCSTQSILQLTATDVPGATYSWAGPNGFTSNLKNPVIKNIGSSIGGIYTVTVTLNGCISVPATTQVIVVPEITTPVAWNSSPVCTGQTLYLEAANYIGATYTWSGPNNFSATTINPTISNVALSDSGTYTVSVTVNGCTSLPAKTAVIVKPTPPPPSASNNGPLCAGETLSLMASDIAGATYQWRNVNGYNSPNQNPVIANVTTADAGFYSVSAIVNGCISAPATTFTVINPLPATPLPATNGPLCVGQTLKLTTGNIPGASFSWKGPNGFTSSDQNPVITTVTLADAGIYFVTATVSGCTSTAGTTNALISSVIDTPAITSNSPICSDGTLILNTPFIDGVSYNWSGPNGFVSSLQNPVINNISSAGSGLYSLTINGCNSVSKTINISVNPTPVISSTFNNGPLCVGELLELNVNSIMGANYKWTGPNGFSSTNQNPVITTARINNAGAYNVVATVNGCTSSPGTTTVSIADSSVTLAGNSQVMCADATIVNLKGSITGGTTTGLWSTNGSGTFSPDNTALNGTYILSNADKSNGNLILRLTSTNNGFCPASYDSVTISVLNAVTVNAGPDRNICASDNQINLSGQATFSVPTVWSTTGTGMFTPSASSLDVSYIPGTSDKSMQSISMILTSISNGACKSVSDTLILKMNPGPSVNAGPDKFVMENSIVMLDPQVTGVNLSYAWTPNLFLNNPSVKNPVVTGVDDQLYTLTVTDGIGCTNKDQVFVKVLKTLQVPNTFTPNNDGINDNWTINNLQTYPDCKVQVFNRYGQLVFQSKGYTTPWNGTLAGKSLPIGTYYYIIEPGNTRKPVAGYVTLMK